MVFAADFFAGAFFPVAAFLEADFAGTPFLLFDFLGALRFCADGFAGDFLATVFFDFEDFLLVFFLVAMRAV
jgi:hypothetical protein